jgi:hypothetical protein
MEQRSRNYTKVRQADNHRRAARSRRSLTRKLRDKGTEPPADRGALERESSTQGSE